MRGDSLTAVAAVVVAVAVGIGVAAAASSFKSTICRRNLRFLRGREQSSCGENSRDLRGVSLERGTEGVAVPVPVAVAVLEAVVVSETMLFLRSRDGTMVRPAVVVTFSFIILRLDS